MHSAPQELLPERLAGIRPASREALQYFKRFGRWAAMRGTGEEQTTGPAGMEETRCGCGRERDRGVR